MKRTIINLFAGISKFKTNLKKGAIKTARSVKNVGTGVVSVGKILNAEKNLSNLVSSLQASLSASKRAVTKTAIKVRTAVANGKMIDAQATKTLTRAHQSADETYAEVIGASATAIHSADVAAAKAVTKVDNTTAHLAVARKALKVARNGIHTKADERVLDSALQMS